jgi:DNA polymerase III subunit gamma/tau
MTLYQEHRPTVFNEVKGNEGILASLQKLLSNPSKCPHAFLLHGPTGCGKTTIARIIANTLGCSGQDLYEIDSGQFRGIDMIREIREISTYRPITSKSRVWILDEAQKLTGDAQSALLKILEDTPEYAYFIICTTEPNKLISPILGRCSQFQVAQLTEQQMVGLLKTIVKKEGDSLEQEVYLQITQDSLGHPRNAINILEQVLASPKESRLNIAKQTAAKQSQSIELCRALIKGAKWREVQGILQGLADQDPESIRRHILGYCQSVLLKGDDVRAGLIMEFMVEPFYASGFPGLVFACYTITKN